MRPTHLAALIGYVSTILLANWLTSHYGLVPVGFGLVATAGTYAAGLAFGLRDLVQDAYGRHVVLFAIVAAALLSYLVASPALAVASGVTFLISETADLAVYTPLRGRSWTGAVLASNLVGLAIDSVLFLWLAGFALTGQVVAGQIVGKLWVTLATVLVIAAVQYRRGAPVTA